MIAQSLRARNHSFLDRDRDGMAEEEPELPCIPTNAANGAGLVGDGGDEENDVELSIAGRDGSFAESEDARRGAADCGNGLGKSTL
jgi:hypothetical protein